MRESEYIENGPRTCEVETLYGRTITLYNEDDVHSVFKEESGFQEGKQIEEFDIKCIDAIFDVDTSEGTALLKSSASDIFSLSRGQYRFCIYRTPTDVPIRDSMSSLESLQWLCVFDLLWPKIRLTVKPSCIFVLPLTRDFEVITLSIAGYRLYAFDDRCSVTLVSSVFVDVEVHDAEVMRILAGRMVAFSKDDVANRLVLVDDKIVGELLGVKLVAEAILGDLINICEDELIQLVVRFHR
jgi:hypothetical protein